MVIFRRFLCVYQRIKEKICLFHSETRDFLDHSPSPALRPCRLTIPHQGVLQALRHAAAARNRSHGGDSEGQPLGGRLFFWLEKKSKNLQNR